MSPNVNKLIREVEALGDTEREELRRLLEKKAAAGQAAATDEDRWAQVLRQRGIIVAVPLKPTPEAVARFMAWRPIEMPGASLSDDLIRDRR